MTGDPDGKAFEKDTRVALDRALKAGLISSWDRMHDGMNPVPMRGKIAMVPYEKSRADFMFTLPDGRRGLIEAKNITTGASITAEYEPAKNDGQQRQIKYHQIVALADEQEHGIGLLIVQFCQHGVYALDGCGLRRWLEDGDEKGNRASISLEHFKAYGDWLGERGNWSLSEFIFTRRAK